MGRFFGKDPLVKARYFSGEDGYQKDRFPASQTKGKIEQIIANKNIDAFQLRVIDRVCIFGIPFRYSFFLDNKFFICRNDQRNPVLDCQKDYGGIGFMWQEIEARSGKRYRYIDYIHGIINENMDVITTPDQNISNLKKELSECHGLPDPLYDSTEMLIASLADQKAHSNFTVRHLCVV